MRGVGSAGENPACSAIRRPSHFETQRSRSETWNTSAAQEAGLTAVAVLQLVEQGKVGLDDPIRKFVPSFPDKGGTITVRHLLTHRSGIRHYREPVNYPREDVAAAILYNSSAGPPPCRAAGELAQFFLPVQAPR